LDFKYWISDFSPGFPFQKQERGFSLDDLAKILKMPFFVISVKTGIQSFYQVGKFGILACTGRLLTKSAESANFVS